MPLVLVQNPVIVNPGYDWKDIEGEQYHFPNQYKNRCAEGKLFVYYRGTRRTGGRRAAPEYFGRGRIGSSWRDPSIPDSRPKKDWAWYCKIEDYEPFPAPVPARIEGSFLEKITRNHWSVGVRDLPQETYDTILRFAGLAPEAGNEFVELPDLRDVTVRESNAPLLIPRSPTAAAGVSDTSGGRYSRRAALIGRRAEEIAHRFILNRSDSLGATNIRWVAQEGLTPGWDLQYENLQGEMIAVEVKGSAGPAFGSIDITAGEWRAALTLTNHYWLYLVANCFGKEPIVQRIQNPARLLDLGEATILPVVYRFSAVSRV